MSWEDALQNSRVVRVNTVEVPTRANYLEALKEAGDISSEEELLTREDLIIDIHQHWLRTHQVGCRFAQALMRSPQNNGMVAKVVRLESGDDMEMTASMLSSKALEAVEEEGVEGLSILLPDFTELAAVCELICSLRDNDNWNLWRLDPYVEPLSKSAYYLVGLDFIQPDRTPSAALGLGPFEELPITRRGPITSLELRVKSANARRTGKRNGDPQVSHLAQVPYNGSLAKTSDGPWQSTVKLRRAVLGTEGAYGDDARAKADVTFAIPFEYSRNFIPTSS